jgi:RNA polymerase sigma-70 factor, ECF subfamily
MEFDASTLERYRLKLRYKVIWHLGICCPDVDDVIQETLTRFLRALREERIRNLESIGAFLNGICNNVIQEYRRRLWREEPYEPEFREDRHAAGPEAELMEVREAIDAGLAQLSDRDRAILRSFYLEDRTREEVCKALGTTDAQFRVALFRAKKRFLKVYRESLKPRATGCH